MSLLERHHQINLPPTKVQKLSRMNGTAGNSVSCDRESEFPVDAFAIAVQAFHGADISQQSASIDMGISETLFSQQFSPNYPDRHPSLRRMSRLPRAYWEEFCRLLAEDLGLALVTPQERQALAQVIDSMQNMLRVLAR